MWTALEHFYVIRVSFMSYVSIDLPYPGVVIPSSDVRRHVCK